MCVCVCVLIISHVDVRKSEIDGERKSQSPSVNSAVIILSGSATAMDIYRSPLHPDGLCNRYTTAPYINYAQRIFT